MEKEKGYAKISEENRRDGNNGVAYVRVAHPLDLANLFPIWV